MRILQAKKWIEYIEHIESALNTFKVHFTFTYEMKMNCFGEGISMYEKGTENIKMNCTFN